MGGKGEERTALRATKDNLHALRAGVRTPHAARTPWKPRSATHAMQTDPREWEAMQKWLQQKTGESVPISADVFVDDMEMLNMASH